MIKHRVLQIIYPFLFMLHKCSCKLHSLKQLAHMASEGWKMASRRLGLGPALFLILSLFVMGGIIYAFTGSDHQATLGTANAAQDGKPAASAPKTQTGLPLPRFVSLKSQRVNVRRGPSNEHGVAWVFTQEKLPVEIVAEFEHWRRVRDSEGAEGWVYHSLLSGRRTVVAAPWAKDTQVELKNSPQDGAGLIARVSSGALGDLNTCDGQWCGVAFGSYEGYVRQDRLFGVYPGETYQK